jgi:hypothetical protein
MSESANVNVPDEPIRGGEAPTPSHAASDPWDWRAPIRWWKARNWWAMLGDPVGDVRHGAF